MTYDELRAATSATVSVSETASVLGLDTRTVLRGVELGQIPAVKVGRRVLVIRERLVAMLSAEPATGVSDGVSRPPEQTDTSPDPQAIAGIAGAPAGNARSPLSLVRAAAHE